VKKVLTWSFASLAFGCAALALTLSFSFSLSSLLLGICYIFRRSNVVNGFKVTLLQFVELLLELIGEESLW
jgi:hypothetical protein